MTDDDKPGPYDAPLFVTDRAPVTGWSNCATSVLTLESFRAGWAKMMEPPTPREDTTLVSPAMLRTADEQGWIVRDAEGRTFFDWSKALASLTREELDRVVGATLRAPWPADYEEGSDET